MTAAANPPSVRDQFVGAWVLKSYHIEDTSTSVRQYPLGRDPRGLILYAPDGHMSATLSKAMPELFDATANMEDVMRPDYPEHDKMLRRWTDYVSYAGTYDVDVEGRRVYHHVRISMFPNNAGHDQVRSYVFGKEGGTGRDTLQLTASFNPRKEHVLLWKRATRQQSVPVSRL